MDHPTTLHVLIEGRVQGVWYRGWTVEQAQALGLEGWVRNLSDGRVEALFSGPAAAVETMVRACRQGPPSAQVKTIQAEEWDTPPGRGFHQRATV
jgi:acylphosphatase